jgi:beta-lactamase class A
MRSKSFTLVVFFVFLLGIWHIGLSSQEQPSKPTGIERLKVQIEGVIQGVEEKVGVAIKHLESGEELYLNGDINFPMASVFKIPIFVEVMAQVKDGKLSLEEEIRIQKPDQHMGSGMLSDLDAPGIALSIRNLINLMMFISDNSATDILLTRVGAENVNARMRQLGITDITVNRTCQHLIMDYLGMDHAKYQGLSLHEVLTDYRMMREENPETVAKAKTNFSSILKDQSTPRAMNKLLELIFQRKIIDEASCDFIIEVMLECQTGRGRIKGDLPRGAKVAHKTGTIGGTVNDSGIIYLPDGMGHVAISLFTKDMDIDTGDVEEIIAQISRFVYDYFYFTS